MACVYLIEDDETLCTECCKLLELNDYETHAFNFNEEYLSAQNIAAAALSVQPDCIILDLQLPGFGNGYSGGHAVCKEIRKTSNVPVLILTSSDSEYDEVMGLNLGADDYLQKPYTPAVLLAHIARLIKRTQGDVSDTIEYHGLTLDVARSTITYKGRKNALTSAVSNTPATGSISAQSVLTSEASPTDNATAGNTPALVELSRNELRILHVLMQNAGRIVSRQNLMYELWQSDEFIDDNTLTVNVNRLRKSLTAAGAPDNFLTTHRGQGYSLN